MQGNLPARNAVPTRVLLVDHDVVARESLCARLAEDGFQISTCAHGAQALERLSEAPLPDLILLELTTPVMDGWQFRVAQRRKPRLAAIPVVAMSADRSAKAEAVDAAAFLHKPFEYQALRDTIALTLSAMERKKAQVRNFELGRLSSLGTLAGGVAHEINNPLTFVSGNLTFAMERCRRAMESDTLESCRSALDGVNKALSEAMVGATRIQNVVRGLSAFARPGSDQTGPIDLNEVLEVALQMTQNEIRHRALLLRDKVELPLVVGSKARLGQVFVNLLLNAAQAIPEGRAQDNQIQISSHTDGGKVVVEIRDTGRGIAPELLGQIYEPFFTTKPAGAGTGLGLSICHSALHALGGSIDVESQLGKGTTFRVSLPVAQVPASADPEVVALSARTTARRSGRVLVIDDEELICSLLVSLLSPEHQVTGLSSAREAMQRIVEGARYDLILCDLMMPDMTGMDFYGALAQHAPEQITRVVFLTGGAFTEASRSFLESVPNPQISKPFSLPYVLELVQRSVAAN